MTSMILGAKALLQLLRPHQWVKNVFVAAPLFFTPSAASVASVLQITLGVVAFSLVSSAVYIVNDYCDREADRLHPANRVRPLAAGTVSLLTAMCAMFTLLVGGLLLAAVLSSTFATILLVYLVVNVAYSMGLKSISIIDVMIIAFGFILRVQAGAALTEVDLSAWMTICVGLLALFLAVAKRRDDIVRALGVSYRSSLAGYTLAYLDLSIAVTMSALLVSYTIFTLDEAVMERHGTERLYTTVPFVVAGVFRYLQIIFVEGRSGSPTTIALTDRFLIVTMLGWVATFGYLIYG